MKIIDGIKLKGKPVEIPDCSRDDLPEFFKEIGFTTGVEVGVSLGENFESYCKAGLKMYGVDPWSNEPDGMYDNRSNITRPLTSMEEVYKHCMNRLKPYSNYTIIRKRSFDAVKDFPKRSLDFVYIDGNHMYGYAAMDIMIWAHRVKRGGIIAVHDYHRVGGSRSTRHVAYATDGYIKSCDIENWYVLGSTNPDPDETQDSRLTCMFFKHW